jgi:hypothetical protein
LLISAAESSETNLKGLKASIEGMPATAGIELNTGELIADKNVIAIQPIQRGVPPSLENDSASFQAIIIPNDGNEFTNRKVVFTPSEGNLSYKWQIPDKANFEEGKSYTYHLTLKGATVVEVSGDIETWEDEESESYGVNEPYLPDGTLSYIKLPDQSVMAVSYINAGSFKMGKLGTEQKDTTLTENFLMGRYEVTNAQFSAFLNASNIRKDGKDTQGHILLVETTTNRFWGMKYSGGKWIPEPGKDNFPAVYVTWYGAQAYTEWVSNGCRLPTSVEWEYASRAGSLSDYYFGSDTTIFPQYAWYVANTDSTREVGTKIPNAWGMYDLYGNAGEWTSELDAKKHYIIRGGYLLRWATECNSYMRYGDVPDFKSVAVGFRVAFTPKPD